MHQGVGEEHGYDKKIWQYLKSVIGQHMDFLPGLFYFLELKKKVLEVHFDFLIEFVAIHLEQGKVWTLFWLQSNFYTSYFDP